MEESQRNKNKNKKPTELGKTHQHTFTSSSPFLGEPRAKNKSRHDKLDGIALA